MKTRRKMKEKREKWKRRMPVSDPGPSGAGVGSRRCWFSGKKEEHQSSSRFSLFSRF
jgi:hypothetical protein